MFINPHGRHMELRINRSIERNNLTVTDAMRNQVERTLGAAPAAHLNGLHRVEIRQTARSGGSANTLEPGQSYFIVLDFDCFASGHNNSANHTFNYTLAHELGHVVDNMRGVFAWIKRNDREGYRAILQHSSTSRSPGEREKFAYVYADIICFNNNSMPMDRAMQAVWNSPAFSDCQDWVRPNSAREAAVP